jgi:hypothetical protein
MKKCLAAAVTGICIAICEVFDVAAYRLATDKMWSCVHHCKTYLSPLVSWWVPFVVAAEGSDGEVVVGEHGQRLMASVSRR